MSSLLAAFVPHFVPRTTGRRQETAGTSEQLNWQVSCQIRAFSLVPEMAPRTLSRWRHGFKSRWDYQAKRAIGSYVSTHVKVLTRAFRPLESAGQAR